MSQERLAGCFRTTASLFYRIALPSGSDFMNHPNTPASDHALPATHGTIRAIICDLGNVLLHFDHRLVSQRLARHLPDSRWDEQREADFWPLVHAFERGHIGSAAFLEEASAVLDTGRSLSAEEFRLLWSDIFWPNTPLIDVLAGLRDDLRLVLLSNTNALHVDFARERFPGLFSVFHDTVYSFEEGSAKPDEAMFRAALRKARAEAGETLYIDDIAAYVDAASALGMFAYQYVSLEGMRDILRVHAVIQE